MCFFWPVYAVMDGGISGLILARVCQQQPEESVQSDDGILPSVTQLGVVFFFPAFRSSTLRRRDPSRIEPWVRPFEKKARSTPYPSSN